MLSEQELSEMRIAATAYAESFPTVEMDPAHVIWLIDRVRALEGLVGEAVENAGPNWMNENRLDEWLVKARTALGKEEG